MKRVGSSLFHMPRVVDPVSRFFKLLPTIAYRPLAAEPRRSSQSKIGKAFSTLEQEFDARTERE